MSDLHTNVLNNTYQQAVKLVAGTIKYSFNDKLLDEEVESLNIIISRSETSKGVLTVTITSLAHKIVNPEQDIRIHQDNMPNGYSGRGIDKKFVTPFLKSANFPSMAESGWLTRSLEQKSPYTLEYGGSITPKALKEAFLYILDRVEEHNANPQIYLTYIFKELVKLRDKNNIELAKPTSLPIGIIVKYLEQHINAKYTSRGASRLPDLVIYSAYQCMMNEVKRFNEKNLMEIEEHTSADSQSGRVGDIEIRDSKNRVFEGVEIKHGIKINAQMIRDAYEKFKTHPIQRYYILSTIGLDENENNEMEEEIKKIQTLHGCQVIINGVIDSLKYYLRLLDDPFEFINYYVKNLENDSSLKFEHKEMWNKIVAAI